MIGITRVPGYMRLNLYKGLHTQVILQCLKKVFTISFSFSYLTGWIHWLSSQRSWQPGDTSIVYEPHSWCLTSEWGIQMAQSISIGWKAKWSSWKISTESKDVHKTLMESLTEKPATTRLNCFSQLVQCLPKCPRTWCMFICRLLHGHFSLSWI